MLIVDDDMLALILRFVAMDKKDNVSDKAFLNEQVRVLRRYLEQFPEAERGQRTMEWVQGKAKAYRHHWQSREAGRRAFLTRCKDCPLRKRNSEEHCEVHEQWLYLLHRYISGEIQSRKYAKRALKLLSSYKKDLKYRSKHRKRQNRVNISAPKQ